MNEKKRWSLRSIIQFLILGIAGGLIYTVIYMKSGYYEGFVQAFSISDADYGKLFTIYSVTTIVTYFLGGVITDRFSVRKLLCISYVGTGALQLYFATFPSYRVVILLYIAMGITTTATYWCTFIKAQRELGQRVGAEAKVYGGIEAVRGFANSIFSTIAAFLYMGAATLVIGLRYAIMLYGATLVVAGILVLVFFRESDSEIVDDSGSETKVPLMKQILECIKIPGVWYSVFIIGGLYTLMQCFYDFMSVLTTEKFMIDAGLSAMISNIQFYVNPIGAIVGGIFLDKVGNKNVNKIIAVSVCVLIAITGITIAMPASANMAIPFIVLFCLFVFASGIARCGQWLTLSNSGVPMWLAGTATGVVSTFAYIPNGAYSTIAGYIMEAKGRLAGIEIVYASLMVFGVLAVVFCVVLEKHRKKHIDTIQAA